MQYALSRPASVRFPANEIGKSGRSPLTHRKSDRLWGMNANKATEKVLETTTSPETRGAEKILSWLCLLGGFGSIVASAIVWYTAGGNGADPLVVAHAERLGIFVGLWAPTYFILSNRFDRAAQSPLGL